MKYVCSDCGKILIEGRDIIGHCYVCPDCGKEGCGLGELVLRETFDEDDGDRSGK